MRKLAGFCVTEQLESVSEQAEAEDTQAENYSDIAIEYLQILISLGSVPSANPVWTTRIKDQYARGEFQQRPVDHGHRRTYPARIFENATSIDC